MYFKQHKLYELEDPEAIEFKPWILGAILSILQRCQNHKETDDKSNTHV